MDREEELCKILLEEAKCAHERLGAFTDSTQKVVATMLSLIALASAYLFSQGADPQKLSYELLFLAAFISLAVAQSIHYNSLAFYYMERKETCGRRLQLIVEIDTNPLDGLAALRNSKMWGTFFWGSGIYYFCEALIGVLLVFGAFCVRWGHGLMSGWFPYTWIFTLGLTLTTSLTTARFFKVADRQLRSARSPGPLLPGPPKDNYPDTEAGKNLLRLLPRPTKNTDGAA